MVELDARRHNVQVLGEDTVKKERVAGADTIKRLEDVVSKFETVKGSQQTFTGKQLSTKIRALGDFLKEKPIDQKESEDYRKARETVRDIASRGGDVYTILTNTYDIRERARKLMQEESSRETRETLAERAKRRSGGMFSRAAVKLILNRADRNERRAEKNRDEKYRDYGLEAEYLSKAGKLREKAADLLEGTERTSQLKKALEDYQLAIASSTHKNSFVEAADNVREAFRIADRLGGRERERLEGVKVTRDVDMPLWGGDRGLGRLVSYQEIMNEAKRRKNESAAEASQADEERRKGYH